MIPSLFIPCSASCSLVFFNCTARCYDLLPFMRRERSSATLSFCPSPSFPLPVERSPLGERLRAELCWTLFYSFDWLFCSAAALQRLHFGFRKLPTSPLHERSPPRRVSRVVEDALENLN